MTLLRRLYDIGVLSLEVCRVVVQSSRSPAIAISCDPMSRVPSAGGHFRGSIEEA